MNLTLGVTHYGMPNPRRDASFLRCTLRSSRCDGRYRSDVGVPPPRARCSQLRWRPIAALPRPFRRTPGRLSRAYHSQEEDLEINLRGYRPTIFVLHRGRWGTGEFLCQPFSDLWVFLQKDVALQTNPIIYDSIVAHFYFTASPQNPQIGHSAIPRSSRFAGH